MSTVSLDGRETVVWSGQDPTPGGPSKGVAEIPLSGDMETRRVRITFDSKRFPGWNEIDAVALEDASGNTYWAVRAIASSTWANQEASNFEICATRALERIQGTYESVPLSLQLRGQLAIPE